MSDGQEGGTAFPIVHPDGKGVQYYGMSLRDYFAAKAVAGLIAGAMSDGSIWDEESASMASQHAYAVADAMLAARSQP